VEFDLNDRKEKIKLSLCGIFLFIFAFFATQFVIDVWNPSLMPFGVHINHSAIGFMGIILGQFFLLYYDDLHPRKLDYRLLGFILIWLSLGTIAHHLVTEMFI